MVGMKNSDTLRRCLFGIGTLLILAACGLFFYNHRESRRAEAQAEAILTRFQALLPNQETTRPGEQGYAPVDIPDYILNPDMEMPAVDIDGNMYIGTLRFSSLDMELPVMRSWSYPALRIAPCLYAGTVYKKNAVIAAHNYACHFGPLFDLEQGDDVCFTDVDGNAFLYEVILKEVLDPTAIEDMILSDFDLSLFTCTYGGATRFVVRCNLL